MGFNVRDCTPYHKVVYKGIFPSLSSLSLIIIKRYHLFKTQGLNCCHKYDLSIVLINLTEILLEITHTRLIKPTRRILIIVEAMSRSSRSLALKHNLPKEPILQGISHEAGLSPSFLLGRFVAGRLSGGSEGFLGSHRLTQRPYPPPITHGIQYS